MAIGIADFLIEHGNFRYLCQLLVRQITKGIQRVSFEKTLGRAQKWRQKETMQDMQLLSGIPSIFPINQWLEFRWKVKNVLMKGRSQTHIHNHISMIYVPIAYGQPNHRVSLRLPDAARPGVGLDVLPEPKKSGHHPATLRTLARDRGGGAPVMFEAVSLS